MNRALPQPKAFTLLEVMIAMFIFFMAIFAILDLVSMNIRAARIIKPETVDICSLAAELTLTNKLTEGTVSGDFGDLYPGFHWTRDIYLVSTNGLFQVDFTVSPDAGRQNQESKLSILLFRPESGTRAGSGVGQGFQMRGGGR